MSIFFSQIKEIFKNQTKDKDFDFILGQYKDKTFRFIKNDIEPMNNCFLSFYNDGRFNQQKTFELLNDIQKYYWKKEWINNNYELSRFNIYIYDNELTKAYNAIKNYLNIKNIYTIYNWKSDWKNVLNQIKNNVDPNNSIELNDFNEVENKIFDNMIEPNIELYFGDTPEKYLEEYDNIFEYKSISDLNENYVIFENKIDCTNVQQGSLGTCYFLETISTLSNYGQLLYQLFPNENINKNGIYEVCLFHEGKWVKVLLDDYFVFYKGTNNFAFTQPVRKCLFSCFLEKAFAKINGSYSNINGGYNCKAFEALTGFETFAFQIKDKNNNIKYINDRIYEYFYKKILDGFLFACNTNDHAYSLINIMKEKNDKIFQIRNPWSILSSEDEDIFNDLISNYNGYQNLKNNDEFKKTGIFYLNKERFEDYFSHIDVCQILFGSTIYSFKLDKLSYKNGDNLYFYFEIFKTSKISVGLIEKNNAGFFQSFSAKLLNLNNNNLVNLTTIRNFKNEILQIIGDYESAFNFDNYRQIEKAKYLLIINFNNFWKLKSKILKVIIEGNVDVIFLGCHKNEKNINYNVTHNIEFTKYNYGMKTGELYKKYKKVIKLLEKEFNIKMHPESKGFYIETIFNDEVETIASFDKEKLKLQVCSYEKKDDIYFLGNNHVNGRIESKKGKAIKIINDKDITIYSGKISKNKFDCENLDLSTMSKNIFLEKPNLFIFNNNSSIKTFLHNHYLKYKSAQSEWTCDFCCKEFDKDIDSFGCRNCNYDLCRECLSMNQNTFYEKLKKRLENERYINIINSNQNNFIIKACFHQHQLEYKLAYNSQKFICDLCKRKYENTKSFNCNLCKFDICFKCLYEKDSLKNPQLFLQKSLKSTCEIIDEKEKYYGFFCKIKKDGKYMYCFITTYLLAEKDSIKIKLNDEIKIISLKNTSRNIWTSNYLFFTCIEIVEEDNLIPLDYFEIDDNCYNENYDIDEYRYRQIAIPVCKGNKEVKGVLGCFQKIVNNKNFFSNSAKKESLYPGLPIIISNNLKIIGAFVGNELNNNINLCVYFRDILGYINGNMALYKNYIICNIILSNKDLNKDTLIFTSYFNPKEIMNNVEVYYKKKKLKLINDKKQYKINLSFLKPGIYQLIINFRKSLTSLYSLFSECNLFSIDLSHFDSSYSKDMIGMFLNCREIEYIDLTNLNTSNVTDMHTMFSGCYKLKEIKGLQTIDTSKVTNMYAMFNNCRQLEFLDLSNFDTSNVTIWSYMLNKCYKLKEIKGKSKIKIDNNPVRMKYDETKSLIVVEDTEVILC